MAAPKKFSEVEIAIAALHGALRGRLDSARGRSVSDDYQAAAISGLSVVVVLTPNLILCFSDAGQKFGHGLTVVEKDDRDALEIVDQRNNCHPVLLCSSRNDLVHANVRSRPLALTGVVGVNGVQMLGEHLDDVGSHCQVCCARLPVEVVSDLVRNPEREVFTHCATSVAQGSNGVK